MGWGTGGKVSSSLFTSKFTSTNTPLLPNQWNNSSSLLHYSLYYYYTTMLLYYYYYYYYYYYNTTSAPVEGLVICRAEEATEGASG